MSWVHDRAEERRRKREREALIEDHIHSVWTALSDCIDECVRDYIVANRQEGPEPLVNGKQPNSKTVSTFKFYDQNKKLDKDRVVVAISKETRLITATYTNDGRRKDRQKTFRVVVMTDDVVGFKDDEHNREMSPDAVCREILDDVLYPDLQPIVTS